ncbi:HalOD1 output domain-containing protein [Halapricum hydrolyticum]|uniref:Halobacterial output domain-containing protein n=1 Tax=Halapricum hydrolyticum TaxID=2979991 RepID=A0AAE3LFY6_9EURY|nr:HalOD1 output domain-containing protein [Halapricum hydrolyticum]MCU4719604.1 hypothetical protein [Halapricum hydrolyticum]MCU4728100.1 hypothetical protein [Halapricum hydrolyticum]
MQSNTRTESWTVLTHWSRQEAIVLALDRAFDELDGVEDDVVIFDYIDPEAIEAVFGGPSPDRGANELRFTCEQHEIRISDDGTIEARSDSEYRIC